MDKVGAVMEEAYIKTKSTPVGKFSSLEAMTPKVDKSEKKISAILLI